MSPKTKHSLKNRLWQARQRAHLAQKQVAAIIHQQTANQISQFEIGARIPNLETALRLSIIYRVPVRALFFGLYRSLQDELKNNTSDKRAPQKIKNLDEFCAFEEFLNNPELTAEEYEKAKRHSIRMVNKASDIHARGKFLNL